jgi:hypothetical protein
VTGPALHLDLLPIAWLVGVWKGHGFTVERPEGGIVEVPVELEVTFGHRGAAVLSYSLRIWRNGVEEDGEVGWWRVRADDAVPGTATLEVLLAHPSGFVEVYVGIAAAATIEIATDLVARTETGSSVSAAQRQYGIRNSQLVFVVDETRDERGLLSYLSGQLEREPGSGWDGISQG